VDKTLTFNPGKIQAALDRRRGKINPTVLLEWSIFGRKEENIKEKKDFAFAIKNAQDKIFDLFGNVFEKTSEEFPSKKTKIYGFKRIKCPHATVMVDDRKEAVKETDLINYFKSVDFLKFFKGLKVGYDRYEVMPDGCISLLFKVQKTGDDKFILNLRTRLRKEYLQQSYDAPTDGLDLRNLFWVVLGVLKISKIGKEKTQELFKILDEVDGKLKKLGTIEVEKLQILVGAKRTNSPRYVEILDTIDTSFKK
jgi:hypothetical protein